MKDYEKRQYLSSIEAAKYMNISVESLHSLVKAGDVDCFIAASGQKRFKLEDLMNYGQNVAIQSKSAKTLTEVNKFSINGTKQIIYIKSSLSMKEIPMESVHLMITSPPYFNAKMYSRELIKDELGNIHNLDEWFDKIGNVWREVYRVLQPGRKAFINIMNLPIREKWGFRSLNLVGRTVDLMEEIGFIFKRDIVWEKTHGVKAHFGTYPYPGGILINNMHEFILEFNKPDRKGLKKYRHITDEIRQASKLDKEFWLSLKNSDVWKMNPENSGDNRSHVAPFPYELPYRIIKAYSFIGETVLDPFVGSGTTLKAAIDLRRNGIGYEIVPEIAEAAVNSLKCYQVSFI
ncbi:MAG: site-specific DNA-methyltransferase [candidate division Zixibacteria bacterium]|nr:site-specific DNA-methyltransferase [Candidatus Tariuqbacter arcticus]